MNPRTSIARLISLRLSALGKRLANGGGASCIGAPTIEGASVEAEVVLPELKGEKLEIQKLRQQSLEFDKHFIESVVQRMKHAVVKYQERGSCWE